MKLQGYIDSKEKEGDLQRLPYEFSVRKRLTTISFNGFASRQAQGNSTEEFELAIPDRMGEQTNRLPLPTCLQTEDVFSEVYRQASMRYGDTPHQDSCFPQFSFPVDNPEEPGKQYIWVSRMSCD